MAQSSLRQRFLAPVVLTALFVAMQPALALDQVPGFELVHDAPVETSLRTPDLRDAVTVWCDMIAHAKHSIDFEQFYVAGRKGESLDRVLDALDAAARRGVRIRFLMEKKGLSASDQETLDRLKAIPNLEFRLLDFARLSGDGIIHAKIFTVDGREAYLGSQNFDWRSVKHIDETGVRIADTHIVGQLQAIFSEDWSAQASIGQGVAVAPLRFADDRSEEMRPIRLVASPNAFDPSGVGDSERELVRLIDVARDHIHVEVMEYSPLARDGGPYPVIDDALRRAARRGVRIRLLVADWSLSGKRLPGLLSLADLPNVDVRVARIPPASAGPIPYARVVHTKVMTIDDKIAWVGTSNWEGGYLDKSRNVELIFRSKPMAVRVDALESQLWTSTYTLPLAQAART